jgi:hypothetical protein
MNGPDDRRSTKMDQARRRAEQAGQQARQLQLRRAELQGQVDGSTAEQVKTANLFARLAKVRAELAYRSAAEQWELSAQRHLAAALAHGLAMETGSGDAEAHAAAATRHRAAAVEDRRRSAEDQVRGDQEAELA